MDGQLMATGAHTAGSGGEGMHVETAEEIASRLVTIGILRQGDKYGNHRDQVYLGNAKLHNEHVYMQEFARRTGSRHPARDFKLSLDVAPGWEHRSADRSAWGRKRQPAGYYPKYGK